MWDSCIVDDLANEPEVRFTIIVIEGDEFSYLGGCVCVRECECMGYVTGVEIHIVAVAVLINASYHTKFHGNGNGNKENRSCR